MKAYGSGSEADHSTRMLMVPGLRSAVHLDALDPAVAAAYGGSADAPASWGRWPASDGEQASRFGAVRRRLRWSLGFPFEKVGSTWEA